MSLSIIFARSINRCIGKNGKIPWHLPDEFGHFKRTTLGKPIIMGRKTYEDHQSALPGRRNIVISRQADYQTVTGIELQPSLDAAIASAHSSSDEVFVIGGVHFFVEAFQIADCVYETIIEVEIDGEAILPEFDFSDWNSEIIERHAVDEKHAYPYHIIKHVRS